MARELNLRISTLQSFDKIQQAIQSAAIRLGIEIDRVGQVQ
jgi:hypothetical protein